MDGRVSKGRGCAFLFFVERRAGMLVESVVLERAVRRSGVIYPLDGVR
jgi:hypothetical protein